MVIKSLKLTNKQGIELGDLYVTLWAMLFKSNYIISIVFF